jgi:RHS repeat-associated protein
MAMVQWQNTTGVAQRNLFDEGEHNVITGEKLIYVKDHLGSVRGWHRLSDGARGEADYSAWGVRTVVSNTTGTMPVRSFTGHYQHAASGLVLAPYRGYDAELGRWLSEDPIGEQGGVNLYGYVGGGPVGAFDMLGLQSSGFSATFTRSCPTPNSPWPWQHLRPPLGPSAGARINNLNWINQEFPIQVAAANWIFAAQISIGGANARPQPFQISPRNEIEANYFQGSMWLNVRNISSRGDGTWTAEVCVSDGLGFNSGERAGTDFERNVQSRGLLGWLFPGRDIERGTWQISGRFR